MIKVRNFSLKNTNLNQKIKIVKVLILFLTVGINSLLAVNSYSQNTKISVNRANTTVGNVIDAIEKQSEYIFFFQDSKVDMDRVVTIDSKDETIDIVLNKLFRDSNNSFTINGRQIYVSESSNYQKQENISDAKIKITGRVVEESGESLIGVTIKVKWTNVTTITDIDGNFEVNVPYANATLELTYIGYEKQDYNLEGKTSVRIIMHENSNTLGEVVVVGHGTQKRESVIGAISSIAPGKLQTNQTRALSNALAGQIAGIIGVQRSGEPGYDSSDFWIRGISTFNTTGSQPLVIVDGVERSMDNISPEEIESFSVLKDAAATAVYGVKGANGAIVIKTKRGIVGAPRVTVKADYGVSSPVKMVEYVDGAKHMEVLNAARTLSGSTADLFSAERIERTRTHYDLDLYPDQPWLKTVTTDHATNNRISMDINGGTERLRYRFMLGTFSENGIIATDKNSSVDTQLKLNRYNVRSNIDMDLTSSTLFSFSVGGHIINRNAPGTKVPDILSWAMETPPIVYPAVYSTGQYAKNVNRANPWVQATQSGYIKNYQNSIQTLASLEQDMGKLWSPLIGLKTKVAFSFDAYNWHEIKRTREPDMYIANGRTDEGELELSLVSKGQEFLNFNKEAGGNRSMYLEVPISYERSFNNLHHINALLLYSQKDYVNADANEAIMAFPFRTQGFAGRFAYDLDHRYFTEFNFGYNGSENFKKGYRFGFFPSFAIGWMVSNESFMKEVSFMHKLKLRGSWGKVGNDQIGGRRFAYVTTINSSDQTGYSWGWNNDLKYNGVREDHFGAYNLTWEESAKTNVGLELGFFNSLNLQVDIFYEKRSNIFMQRKTIPELGGYNQTPYANYGKVDNKGLDLSLDYTRNLSEDLSLSAMATLTYAKNKIVEYDEALGIVGTNRAKTGWGVKQNFGLIADGLYTEDDFINPEKGILKNHLPKSGFGIVKPGDIKYVDIDGDNEITPNDVCAIGRPSVPEIVYGFGLSLRYKRMDFGAMFQGITNVDFIISGNEMIPGSGDGSLGNILTNVDDRWTLDNPSQDVFYPRLSRNRNENNNQLSTWWLKDGSFLRLKHVELGYTIVSQRKGKLPFQNARVFARGSNLLTFSPFKLWDPELLGTGYKSYPSSKIISVGFDITF